MRWCWHIASVDDDVLLACFQLAVSDDTSDPAIINHVICCSHAHLPRIRLRLFVSRIVMGHSLGFEIRYSYRYIESCTVNVAKVVTGHIKFAVIHWKALYVSVTNIKIRICRNSSQTSDISAVSLHCLITNTQGGKHNVGLHIWSSVFEECFSRRVEQLTKRPRHIRSNSNCRTHLSFDSARRSEYMTTNHTSPSVTSPTQRHANLGLCLSNAWHHQDVHHRKFGNKINLTNKFKWTFDL